jgi:hypothetical protein
MGGQWPRFIDPSTTVTRGRCALVGHAERPSKSQWPRPSAGQHLVIRATPVFNLSQPRSRHQVLLLFALPLFSCRLFLKCFVSLTVGTRSFFMELAETTAAGTESRRADRDRSRQGSVPEGKARTRPFGQRHCSRRNVCCNGVCAYRVSRTTQISPTPSCPCKLLASTSILTPSRPEQA